ncbi:hypothetical protein C4559_05510 [Candidatus Microgenomates bacterium]|nr:MAG: hypothetical protein C4559_05510 [Candidatus Microgenomates bacterium]
MINPAELRRGPRKPEVITRVTEERVRGILAEKIETAIAITKQTKGIFESATDAKKAFILLEMNGEAPYALVCNIKGVQIGRFDKAAFQAIAFEVMVKNGLDVAKSRPKYKTGRFDSQGSVDLDDGVSRQTLVYPSQTVKGLFFERELDYWTGTDAPISVSWWVEGHKQEPRKKIIR